MPILARILLWIFAVVMAIILGYTMAHCGVIISHGNNQTILCQEETGECRILVRMEAPEKLVDEMFKKEDRNLTALIYDGEKFYFYKWFPILPLPAPLVKPKPQNF